MLPTTAAADTMHFVAWDGTSLGLHRVRDAPTVITALASLDRS
jgi:hypothetical protein